MRYGKARFTSLLAIAAVISVIAAMACGNEPADPATPRPAAPAALAVVPEPPPVVATARQPGAPATPQQPAPAFGAVAAPQPLEPGVPSTLAADDRVAIYVAVLRRIFKDDQIFRSQPDIAVHLTGALSEPQQATVLATLKDLPAKFGWIGHVSKAPRDDKGGGAGRGRWCQQLPPAAGRVGAGDGEPCLWVAVWHVPEVYASASRRHLEGRRCRAYGSKLA